MLGTGTLNLIPTTGFEGFVPGVPMTDPNGNPISDGALVNRWLGYIQGTSLKKGTNSSGSITYQASSRSMVLPSSGYMMSENTFSALSAPLTFAVSVRIDTFSNFGYIFSFDGAGGGANATKRLYLGTASNQLQFYDGGAGASATFGGWNGAFANLIIECNGASSGIYDYTNPSSPVTIWTGTLLGGLAGNLLLHASDTSGSNSSSSAIRISSLHVFTTRTLTAAEKTAVGVLLGDPVVPLPYAGSLDLRNISVQSDLIKSINAAPGSFGGLVRAAGQNAITNGTAIDQSAALQTLLTNNAGIEMPQGWDITGQHLTIQGYGQLEGNNSRINISPSYTVLEQDWIMGFGHNGNIVQTTNAPILSSLRVSGYNAAAQAIDGSRYGTVPTKQLAGIWFADTSPLPSSCALTLGSGRAIGGGAEFCTFGIRMTAGQYCNLQDARIGTSNIGLLLDSQSLGQGNTDLQVSAPIIFGCDVGTLVANTSTQGGFVGLAAGIVVKGGKHNGQNGLSICNWAAISPWWRDGVHLQDGLVTFQNSGTEYIRNDGATYWEVGKTFYIREWNSTAGTVSYPFGVTPKSNLDGQPYLVQNALSHYYQAYYIPPCSFYAEGTTLFVTDPQNADNHTECGIYRTGPYGVMHITNALGGGIANGHLTKSDDPATGQFYFYKTCQGDGYAQNVFRWPDVFAGRSGPFYSFVVGGGDQEFEISSPPNTVGFATATVSAGGGSYQVGDILIGSGGTFVSPVVLEIITISGSAVATVAVLSPGMYSILPASPISVVGGHGSGATFTFTSRTNGVPFVGPTSLARNTASNYANSHQDNISESVATRNPGFPSLINHNIAGGSSIFSIVTASEGMFIGRKVTQLIYPGTVNTTFGTLQTVISVGNNQPLTVNFSAAAPANGTLITIGTGAGTETFYVISGGGGSTNVQLARGVQDSRLVTHSVGETAQTVGAYLGGPGQWIETNWLAGYGTESIPSTAVDSAGFLYLHNTNSVGINVNFDIFMSGNSQFQSGANVFAWAGRQYIPARSARSIRFQKNNYQSDYKIAFHFDAQQSTPVTLYVTALAFKQVTPGQGDAALQRMLANHEWQRNIL